MRIWVIEYRERDAENWQFSEFGFFTTKGSADLVCSRESDAVFEYRAVPYIREESSNG